MSDPVRERWEAAGAGWRRRADRVQAIGMPVSAWMIDRLRLQPGQELLELAAGPGDTGFMAAELVQPGGSLISSDAVESMLDIARERAAAQGIEHVTFKPLELEWIDLETASVDAALCRWGIMFLSDPAAAMREMRRVLRPGGRVALAVWDEPEVNPWATIPTRALVELGHTDPPDPTAPGMFSMSEPGRLQALLEEGGFTEIEVESIDVTADRDVLEVYLDETTDLSVPFAEVRERLAPEEWPAVVEKVRELTAPFAQSDGTLRMPGRALGAAASA
jgi:ubiquinone/menaquinone biosynthesis C-methylase UbiE